MAALTIQEMRGEREYALQRAQHAMLDKRFNEADGWQEVSFSLLLVINERQSLAHEVAWHHERWVAAMREDGMETDAAIHGFAYENLRRVAEGVALGG